MANKHWIFLRGLGRHQGHWADFPKMFQERFPGDTVELLDLPGTGTERGRSSPWSIPKIVEDLRKRRHGQEPASLLAISMGAMVATEWAHLYPYEISELVLINTSDRGTAKFFERLRFNNYPRLLRMLGEMNNRSRFEQAIIDLTLPANVPPKIHKIFAELEPTSPRNWLRHIVASAGYRFPETAPIQKILLLSARGDRLVHPECTRRIANRWNRSYKEHPAGAHDLPIADGAWILDRIQELD